jgi:hypothetical protein
MYSVLVVEPDIFLIQRFFFLAMFIPHEDFPPQKNVHSSTRGSEGGFPLLQGLRGYSLDWGV